MRTTLHGAENGKCILIVKLSRCELLAFVEGSRINKYRFGMARAEKVYSHIHIAHNAHTDKQRRATVMGIVI